MSYRFNDHRARRWPLRTLPVLRGTGQLMRRFVAVLIAMAWLVLPVAGQSADSNIRSKEDARQLFAMSRRQWEENIRGAVARGMAMRVSGTPVGMKVMAPGAPVTTRLDYSRGDAKPAAVYVLVEFPPDGASPLTPSMDNEMLVVGCIGISADITAGQYRPPVTFAPTAELDGEAPGALSFRPLWNRPADIL